MTLPLPPSCVAIHSAMHRRDAVPVGRDGQGAGLGHHLVEADDDDAGVAGLLDGRVERRVGTGIDEDRIGLLRG